LSILQRAIWEEERRKTRIPPQRNPVAYEKPRNVDLAGT